MDTWKDIIKYKQSELEFYGSFDIAFEAYQRGEILPGTPPAFDWQISNFLHEIMPDEIKAISFWIGKAKASLHAIVETLYIHYPNGDFTSPKYISEVLETLENMIKNDDNW